MLSHAKPKPNQTKQHHTHTQTALKHTHNTAHRTATQKPKMETHTHRDCKYTTFLYKDKKKKDQKKSHTILRLGHTAMAKYVRMEQKVREWGGGGVEGEDTYVPT